MANSTGSKYLYQNAVLKELARPSSETAAVSLETPATEYAASRSLADAAQVKLSDDVAFKNAALEEGDREFEANLAERERQFLSNMLFAHDQLSDFSRQNDIANLIAIGNIGVQGVAGYQQNERLEKQDETYNSIKKTYAEMPNMVTRSLADIAKQWQTGVKTSPDAEAIPTFNPGTTLNYDLTKIRR